MDAVIRPAASPDAEACGSIIYEAFAAFAARTGFPPSFPTKDVATTLAPNLVENPAVFGVVAERAGRVVGSNFLTEGDRIRGVGPVTVDPSVQGVGLGRRLMQAVLDRGKTAEGIRLVQDSANVATLSLYAKLGFDVKEPLLALSGSPTEPCSLDLRVRRLELSDLPVCNELCAQVHGFDRTSDLAEAREPFVVLRGDIITGYLTSASAWPLSHGVAASEKDMRALLSGISAATGRPIALLLPTRQAGLLRWCLASGLRAQRPMTLMAWGAYREPAGAWFPSVWY